MAHTMAGNLDGPTNFKEALEERGFHVLNILGEGSFGQVIKATCQDDGKLYAIKIIRLGDEERTKYPRRELDILVNLRKSNRYIIEYIKKWVIEDGDERILCIQMELCWLSLLTFLYDTSGVEIIKAEGPPLYQHVFPQILNGLSAIHSIQCVHRDIHLGNILVVNPNPQQINDIHVKIADFGLARYIGKQFETSVGLTVGLTLEKLSPGVGNEFFRAPELSTEKYDFKVDIYSSGIVLYLLDRYLPDKSQLDDEILALRNDKRNRNYLYHKNDDKLAKLIHALLQKESKDRPTATDALQYMLTENHGSEIPCEPKTKFFATKRGDDTCYRLSSSDTLSSMQEAIQEHPYIHIEKNAQILKQKKQIGNETTLVGITSDEDVREMFQSAEKQGNKVIVVVFNKNEKPPDIYA